MSDPSFLWDETPLDSFQLHTIYEKTTVLFVLIEHDIETTFAELQHWIKPFLLHYPWSIQPPKIRLCSQLYHNKNGESMELSYVFGELIIGDNYMDEKLILHLLVDFTRHNDCFIHFTNTAEGETLLVTSFDKLNETLQDPLISSNRPWIYKGSVVVVNDHNQKAYLPLNRAIAQLHNKDFEQSTPITEAVEQSLSNHNATYCFGEIYDIKLKLPTLIASLLANNAWLLPRSIDSISRDNDDSLQNLESLTSSEQTVNSYPVASHTFALIRMLYQNDPASHDIAVFSANLFLRGLNAIYASIKQDLATGNFTSNSRIVLQNELISQDRLTNVVAEDHQLLAKILEEHHEEKAEKQSDELMSRVKMFMENESDLEKIMEETAEEGENEVIASKDELNALLDTEYADFADFILENKQILKQNVYNDDSDYSSNGEEQNDMNYDEYLKLRKSIAKLDVNEDFEEEVNQNDSDEIIDVDSEEDIAPYDYPEESRQWSRKYVQESEGEY